MQFLISLFFLLNSDTCRATYLNEVFNTKTGEDYYLVVNSKSNKGKSVIVLSRTDLSQNLSRMKSSIESARKKIENGTFILPLNNSSKWFFEVKYFKEISEAKLKGKKYFINKYFDEQRLLKENVPVKYFGQIVQVLFNWNLLVKHSEWGGELYVHDKEFCK